MITELAFWCSVALVFYAYAGYPCALIIVASDCSTDSIDKTVAAYSPRVRLVRAAERKGKEAAQQLAVDAASGAIPIFSDVATTLNPDALSTMAPTLRTRRSAVSAASIASPTPTDGRAVKALALRPTSVCSTRSGTGYLRGSWRDKLCRWLVPVAMISQAFFAGLATAGSAMVLVFGVTCVAFVYRDDQYVDLKARLVRFRAWSRA